MAGTSPAMTKKVSLVSHFRASTSMASQTARGALASLNSLSSTPPVSSTSGPSAQPKLMRMRSSRTRISSVPPPLGAISMPPPSHSTSQPISFHEALGFEVERIVEDYDGPGEDRALLVRRLT